MCGIDPSPYRPRMIKDTREATTAQEQQQTLRRIARGSVLTCVVLLAIPLLLLGTLIVTYAVERATPEDYPTASRHKTSARIDGNARAAYEAAGFDRSPTKEPVGDDACYPDGLEGMADEPVEGAYELALSWSMTKVPRDQALPALRDIRERFTARGWEIIEDERFATVGGSGGRVLRIERDGDQQSFYWYAHDNSFEATSRSACAYKPGAAKGSR
jgi:hypothetical protein